MSTESGQQLTQYVVSQAETTMVGLGMILPIDDSYVAEDDEGDDENGLDVDKEDDESLQGTG